MEIRKMSKRNSGFLKHGISFNEIAFSFQRYSLNFCAFSIMKLYFSKFFLGFSLIDELIENIFASYELRVIYINNKLNNIMNMSDTIEV